MYQLMKGIAYCHEHRVLHRVRIISRHRARDGHGNRSEYFFGDHPGMQRLIPRLYESHISKIGLEASEPVDQQEGRPQTGRFWTRASIWYPCQELLAWGMERQNTENNTLACRKSSLSLPLLVCSLFYGVKRSRTAFFATSGSIRPTRPTVLLMSESNYHIVRKSMIEEKRPGEMDGLDTRRAICILVYQPEIEPACILFFMTSGKTTWRRQQQQNNKPLWES